MADPTSQEIDDYLASPTSEDIDAYLASEPVAPAVAAAGAPQYLAPTTFLSAAKPEGAVARTVRTVREGLSPLIGRTKNQRLKREQDALAVANTLPAISRHVEAQRPNLVEQEDYPHDPKGKALPAVRSLILSVKFMGVVIAGNPPQESLSLGDRQLF